MKIRPGGLVAALAILLAACGGGGDSAATSAPSTTSVVTVPEGGSVSGPAQVGDLVGLFYTGTLDDGTQFGSNVGGTPLTATLGSDQLIPGFDAAVVGHSVGDTFTVRIEAADAYGERSDDNIIELPAAGAPAGLAVGDQVQLANGATVVVLAVGEDTITVDANHPLAGQALTFEITIDSITR